MNIAGFALSAFALVNSIFTDSPLQTFINSGSSIEAQHISGFPFAPDQNGRICFPVDFLSINPNGIHIKQTCNRYPDLEPETITREKTMEIETFLSMSETFLPSFFDFINKGESYSRNGNDTHIGCDSVIRINVNTGDANITIENERQSLLTNPKVSKFVSAVDSLFFERKK